MRWDKGRIERLSRTNRGRRGRSNHRVINMVSAAWDPRIRYL